MTGFVTATLNCDGAFEGLGESRYCPGWFEPEERATIAKLRSLARNYGWTRDGERDFCAHHSDVRAHRATA